jgi:hypothetical protein
LCIAQQLRECLISVDQGYIPILPCALEDWRQPSVSESDDL